MATAMVEGENLTALLTSKSDTISELLPPRLSGEAERLIKRALLTFHTGSAELRKCTPRSFVMAVLKGAECGLAIDGKLGHAVPFNVKKKDQRGTEYWEMEATFIPDYKGLISVAKANGTIQDAWAWVVCANDHFEASDEDGKQRYCFRPNFTHRGERIGVLSVARINADYSRWDYLTITEVDTVRARSKAKNSGPWVTDYNEMAKKTGIKRLLKLFQHDVQLSTALDADNVQYDVASVATHVARKSTVVRPFNVNEGGPRVALDEANDTPADDLQAGPPSLESEAGADEGLDLIAEADVKLSACKTAGRIGTVVEEFYERAARLGTVAELEAIAEEYRQKVGNLK